MKSRVLYQPWSGYNWVVEKKAAGLFQSWERVESYQDKGNALKMAAEILKSGVVWSSESDGEVNG